jgi:hypothetical protein
MGRHLLRHFVLGACEAANSALVSDVCAAALRAFYNAPQRER